MATLSFDPLTTWMNNGGGASIIVNSSGEILTSGSYWDAQNNRVFTKVALPQNKKAAAVSTGSGQIGFGAIATDGSVYLWGYIPTSNTNTYTNISTPQLYSLANGKLGKNIVFGFDTIYVICTDGTLQGMGANNTYQLANGTTTFQSSFIEITLSKSVTAISLLQRTPIVVCSDGTIQGWGLNAYGELGLGHSNQVTTPTAININGKVVTSVGSSFQSSILLLNDGTIMVSGTRFSTNVFTAFALADNKTAKMIGWGSLHMGFLCTDNTLQFWGRNMSGQIGNGTNTDVTGTPVTVQLANGKVPYALCCGSSHTIVICTDGSVQTWGYNALGALGLNSLENYYNTPQETSTYANNGAPSGTAPDAPTITSTKVGVRAISIGWSAPTNNGGAEVTGYIVSEAAGKFSDISLNAATTTSTFTSLDSSSSYVIRVAAVNSYGTGTAASTSSTTPFPEYNVKNNVILNSIGTGTLNTQLQTMSSTVFTDVIAVSARKALNVYNDYADASAEAVAKNTYIDAIRTIGGNSVAIPVSGFANFVDSAKSYDATAAQKPITLYYPERLSPGSTTRVLDVTGLDWSGNSYSVIEAAKGDSIQFVNGVRTTTITYTGTAYVNTATNATYSIGDIIDIGNFSFKIFSFGSLGGGGTINSVFKTFTVTPGNGSVTLTWDYSGNGTFFTVFKDSLPVGTEFTATSPYTVTGLTNGTTYQFNVQSFTSADANMFVTDSGVKSGTPTSGGGGGGGPIPCFPTGTLIRTPAGDKPVETLATGDYVLTADNRPVPIRLHSFTVEKATEANAPYVVPAHALGYRQPTRTLHLSPHHAFQIRPGVWQMPLLAAERSTAIQQYGLGEPVTYYHVECPNFFRDNLVADGVVCESFGSNQTKGMKGVYRFAPALGGYTRISNPVHTPSKTH